MVQTTLNNEFDSNAIRILESQIRECFGRVVWTHKTHEKCSDIYADQLKNLKIWEIILSALTTTSLLTSIFGDHKIGTIVAAFSSTAVLIINIYTKDHDLGKLSQKHAEIANQLWNIRESYISLIADIKSNNLTVEQIKQKRDELQKSLNIVYQNAPRTNSKAYELASKSLNQNGQINQGEEMTFSDEEINRFLPSDLRKYES